MNNTPPFIEAVDLSAHGSKYCHGCGNKMVACMNVKHGTYCAATTIRYFNNGLGKDDELIAKRIFIDSYTRAVEQEKYKKTKELGDLEVIYPPACVEFNSLKYCFEWLEWKKKGCWTKKGASVPRTYYEH